MASHLEYMVNYGQLSCCVNGSGIDYVSKVLLTICDTLTINLEGLFEIDMAVTGEM